MYSIDNPDSMRDVKRRWYPEIDDCSSNTPFILLGNKSDVRSSNTTDKFVTTEKGQKVANKLNASAFVRNNHLILYSI